MLDDFRDQASTSSYFEDDDTYAMQYDQPRARPFLGMTPVQRFVIALMLLVIICVLGSFCLIVTDKIVLPFI